MACFGLLWQFSMSPNFRTSLLHVRFSSLTLLKKALVNASISSRLPLVDIKSPSCSKRPLKIVKTRSKSSLFDFANFLGIPFRIHYVIIHFTTVLTIIFNGRFEHEGSLISTRHNSEEILTLTRAFFRGVKLENRTCRSEVQKLALFREIC